ncbi:MAG: transposase, partial [Lachnospiraceae bacterium]|nr:transposase [Lachnospiraceae bacterium]
GKYFIHIPVTYESPDNEPADGTQTIVGIDRGLRFLVTSYDSNGHTAFYSGKEVIQKRRHYSKLRQQLQKRGTRSSKRRLKAISGKEHRYMSDVNHCISKKLVQSYPQGTAFVLEDLSGIRDTTVKVTKKQRYQMCSWSFSDLAQKLEYKAARNGSSVIRIDPHYTSQTCPRCQYVDKSNRNKKLHEFCCKHCGYRSNDDRVGAMNIMNKGMDLLRQGNGYPGDNQVPEQM